MKQISDKRLVPWILPLAPTMLSSWGFCLLYFPSTFPFFALLRLPSLLALWPCTAAFPSILLPVCLIAGHGYVVYLTQNRTPLLFQRVEPLPSTQDGEPGLNNTHPPAEAADNVNSLWVGCYWVGWFAERASLKCMGGVSQVCTRWRSRKPLMDDSSSSGDVPKDWQLESWGNPWGRPGKHDQFSGRNRR